MLQEDLASWCKTGAYYIKFCHACPVTSTAVRQCQQAIARRLCTLLGNNVTHACRAYLQRFVPPSPPLIHAQLYVHRHHVADAAHCCCSHNSIDLLSLVRYQEGYC